ncbi:MAG: hypothetical protein ACRC1T_05305 [Clostridium chrysemydis]|uniref:hypothetical protein n=1 Tax=Clostridium chrysemydis TaxID=2665504 RepID=UPI003F378E7C
MWYVGSKNKLSKELVPVIQSYITKDTKGYLEPFVGGANMIDKIKCNNKIGCDIHKELIALLNKAKNEIDNIPDIISEETYNEVKNNKSKYEDWYVGLVGFCATFGAKWFGGYARSKADKYNGEKTVMAIKNLKKQAPNLKDVKLKNCSFLDLPKDKIKGYVIYCDIPYRGTTKYKTEAFPYEEFYKWANEMAKDNTVLISEYNMPKIFKCIWQKETKANFDSNRKLGDEGNKRVEKLFVCNADNGYIYDKN